MFLERYKRKFFIKSVIQFQKVKKIHFVAKFYTKILPRN